MSAGVGLAVTKRQQKWLVFAVLLLAAMYLLNLVIDNPYTHRFVRRNVDRILRESTYLTADYRVMRVQVFPPALDLYGLEVGRARGDGVDGPGDLAAPRRLLSAAHIRATVSLWSLLIGQPQLASVEANNLRLEVDDMSGLRDLVKPTDGKPRESATEVWPPPFPVPVRRVILRNSNVMLFQAGRARPVPYAPESFIFRGESIDMALTIQGWDSATLALSAADVGLRAGGTTYLSGANLVADATYNTNTVDLKISRMDSAGLSGDGSVRVTMDQLLPQLNLRRISGEASVRLKGDIGIVGAILDIPETLGPAKASVLAKFSVPVGDAPGKADFSVVADTESAGARFGGYKLHEFKARLDIDANRIAFEDVRLFMGEKNYGTGKGILRFDGPGLYSFQIQPDALPLGKLLDVFEVDFDAFDMEMTAPDLELSGTSSPFRMKASASVAARNISLPATPYDHSAFPVSPDCQLGLRLDIDSNRIVFDGTGGICRSSGTATSLELSGPITFNDRTGINLLVNARQADARIGEYFAQVPLRGNGSFSARVHGPYSRVLISGDLNLAGFQVDKMRPGQVTGNWQVDGDVVTWENIRAVPEEGAEVVLEKGSLNVADKLKLATEVRAANLTPAFISGFMQTLRVSAPVSFGVESLQGHLAGFLEDPLWWDVDATASAFDLIWEDYHLADHAAAKIAASREGWRISEINILRGDLAVDGRVKHARERVKDAIRSRGPGLSGRDSLDIDAKFYSISNLKSEADHLSSAPWLAETFKSLGIAGFLGGEIKLGGRMDSLEGAFDMSVLRPRLMGSAIAPLRVKGVVAGSRGELIINQGGNALEGRMSLDLGRPEIPFEWFFSANRVDLRFVATPWFAADPRNYLYLSGSWNMKGTFRDFWESRGALNIASVDGRLLREVVGEQRVVDFKSEEPFEVAFEGGPVKATASRDLVIASKQARVRATLRDNNRLPRNVNLGLDGNVDLSLLRDLVPQIESATGKVSFKGQLTGPVDRLAYAFDFADVRANPFTAGSWEPVSLGLADFRPPLRNIRLKATLHDGILQVDSFTAQKGGGRIDGAGTLALGGGEEGAESSLDVRLEDAAVVYPVAFLKSFESNISGNLSLTGRGRPYRLSGDLQITKARSTREIDLAAEILSSIRKQAIVIPSAAADPVIQFDLAIRADQTVNVNNRLIQALLSTNLQVGGSDQQPSVLGQIDVVRGKFVYKRDFSITRGIISFDDPLRVDPTLEITAVSEVQNYRVYINMSGRASNPRVDFSIDPPTRQNGTAISKVDILVLLGRGSLPEEQQALGETQNVAATEALGFIWGQLDEPVEKLFDLSGQKVVKEVYFDTYASPEGKPLLRVNLPLNLGEDLDVVLRVDQEQSMKLSSDVSLSENISLGVGVERQSQSSATSEGQTTVPADTGADLKFRFSFP